MSGVSAKLADLILAFPAKAGETGKLYGSITPVQIAEMIKSKTGVEITRRQMDSEPIRTLGTHKIHIRLTIDLIPEITVIVHREGEQIDQRKPEIAPVVAEQPVEEVVPEVEAEEEISAEA